MAHASSSIVAIWTWLRRKLVPFGASREGLVPDPGSSPGTTKYLREDSTWQVPPGGAGGDGSWARTFSTMGS